MRLARAYYHCARCRHGFCPRDRGLGVEGASLSPAVTRMVGTVAGDGRRFAGGSDLLGDLAGLPVNAKQVERTAEALGCEMAVDERRTGRPRRGGRNCAHPEPGAWMAGGCRCANAEVADRPGKQGDGSAKTREVKLCTVWSAEGRDTAGVPVRDAGSISYSAAIERAAGTPSWAMAPLDLDPGRRGLPRGPSIGGSVSYMAKEHLQRP